MLATHGTGEQEPRILGVADKKLQFTSGFLLLCWHKEGFQWKVSEISSTLDMS